MKGVSVRNSTFRSLLAKTKEVALSFAAITTLALPSASFALDKVKVAYFLEWPTANQVAQIEKAYDKEMGVELEWRAFGNGNEMTQAMVSGDIDFAYSQGFVPFVVGVTNDAPITMIGIAVTYAENDLCIVRDDAGITKENAKDLEGKKIATPIGNVTYYKFLRTMEHLGVDVSKIDIVQMNPADAAVALIRGDVVMGCAFGGSLGRMKTVGKPLMTGAEQEAVGINTFDIISVNNDFKEKYPDLVKKFMEVTDKSNKAYAATPDAATPTISKAAGMDLDATRNMLKNFGFPLKSTQLSDNWMGGGVQRAAKGVAEVMHEAGGLEKVLDDYSASIDASFLK